jgi:hypothetical protein
MSRQCISTATRYLSFVHAVTRCVPRLLYAWLVVRFWRAGSRIIYRLIHVRRHGATAVTPRESICRIRIKLPRDACLLSASTGPAGVPVLVCSCCSAAVRFGSKARITAPQHCCPLRLDQRTLGQDDYRMPPDDLTSMAECGVRPMLTLRPTGLSSPAYRNWLDYVIVADGRAVGRILRGSPHPAGSALVLVHHGVRRSEAGHQYERPRREPG